MELVWCIELYDSSILIQSSPGSLSRFGTLGFSSFGLTGVAFWMGKGMTSTALLNLSFRFLFEIPFIFFFTFPCVHYPACLPFYSL